MIIRYCLKMPIAVHTGELETWHFHYFESVSYSVDVHHIEPDSSEQAFSWVPPGDLVGFA